MPDPFTHDFGGSLREARERAGVTLRAISVSTKISVPTLEALERNDLSRLPGGLFTRAFVRGYAREVGLDPERTLSVFLSRFPDAGGDAELHDVGAASLEGAPRSGAARALRRMAWALPVLVGIAYFAFLRADVDFASLSRSSPTTVAAPPVPAAPVRAAAAPSNPPAPEVEADGTAPAVEPAAMSSQGPSVVVPAEEPVGQLPEKPAAGAAAIPDGVLRLALAPAAACWVSVKAGGQAVYSGLLQAGERREFDLRGEVSLRAGDAGALAFAVNGQPGRALGKPGEAVTLRFSTETLSSVLAPR